MKLLLSTWDQLSPLQRISAVNVDIMNHPKFSTLSGAIMMGVNALQDGLPTAGTNGRDIYYGAEFVMRQSRKQLRYAASRATHIALRHCIEYTDLVQQG
jgi:hypothetical protein